MQADTLILHIDWLVTVDEKRRIIRDAAIAIRDGKFIAIDKSAAIEAQFTASQSRPFRRQPERPSVAEVKESGGRGG